MGLELIQVLSGLMQEASCDYLLKSIAAIQLAKKRLISTNPSGNALNAEAIKTMGIWQRQENDTWIRNEAYFNEWGLWADRQVIPPKQTEVIRIVLLGESAARGYLFDPIITPAQLLEDVLNQASSTQKFEVIDLARTDITLAGLGNLMQSVAALKPNYIWFFCGNNWLQLESLSAYDLLVLANLIKTQGLYQARPYVQEVIEKAIDSLLTQLFTCAAACQAEIIMTIPEFNLNSWRQDQFSPSLKLPVNTAFQHNNDHQAIESLQLKTELENGLNAQTFEQLGDAFIKLNQFDQAKTNYIRARDAVIGLPIKFSPRCCEFIQVKLRNYAKQNHLILIDLPEIFATVSDNAIPGDNVFLDYCHLNLHGFYLLVSSISKNLTQDFTGSFDVNPYISDKELAVVYFMAAIHNAHYGQLSTSIDHYISKAIEQDETIKIMMTAYLEATTKYQVPLWMSKEFRLMAAYSPIICRYLLAKNLTSISLLNETLLRRSIAKFLPIVSGHTKNTIKLTANLLDFCHWSVSRFFALGFELVKPSIYFKAKHKVSHFNFEIAQSCDIQFSCTLKVPGKINEDKIKLFLNGILLKKITPINAWKSFEIITITREGNNTLTIEWPEIEFRNPDVFFASELERLSIPAIFQSYGFIYSLQASLIPLKKDSKQKYEQAISNKV